ncbi:vWA domain-containing protein [Streptomyces sp. NPDC001348]
MANRPVHFIWILDCSDSMRINGKIGELNFAIREVIPEMRKAADENPAASLLVRAITFAEKANWHVEQPTPIHDFTWNDVKTSGWTSLGAALKLAATALEMPPMPERALRPVLALVSDGQPTDDWRAGMRAVDATPWGKRAVRVAVAIGQDADKAVLKEFLANPEMDPILASNPQQLVRAIRWASTMAVRASSTPVGGGDNAQTTPLAKNVPPPPPAPVADDDDDVW